MARKRSVVKKAAAKVGVVASTPMDTDFTIQALLRDAAAVQEFAEATAENVNIYRCALRDARDALQAALDSKRLRKPDREKTASALKTVRLVLADREPYTA